MILRHFLFFCWALSFFPATFQSWALPAEWKFSQSFALGQTGLVKIAVPLTTLTSSRAGRPDLRLLDPDGNQLPFATERPALALPFNEASSTFKSRIDKEATVLEFTTTRSETPDFVYLETTEVEFLKAAMLEASTDGGRWQIIARGVPLFRRTVGSRQLRLPLPAGVWHQFRVTIDDHRSPPVPFTGAKFYFASPTPVPTEPLSVEILEQIEEPGQTRINLRLGGANLVLEGLTLNTPEPLFSRAVSLTQTRWVDGEAQPILLLNDVVYRSTMGTTNLAPKLSLGRGLAYETPLMSLIIENLDNPPLVLNGLTARYRSVFIVFNAARQGTYTFLSGNPDCPPPRYDIDQLESQLQGAQLLLPTPSPLTVNPDYQRADKFAMVDPIGAPLDIAPWQFRKLIPISAEGVHQLELDIDVLANSAARLADLRLVQQGRQIPYILDRTPILRTVQPAFVPANDPKRPTVSRWQLTLPRGGVWFSSLTSKITTPYFRREVRLVASRRDHYGNFFQETLGSTIWARLPEDKPKNLTLPLSSAPSTNTVFLEIENDDNPPLELSSVQLWWPTSRLVFKAKPTDPIALYYGNIKAAAPRYDLEILGHRLLAADKTSAILAPEEVLKPTTTVGHFNSGSWFLWLVLAFVAAGLFFVISRLLPKPRA